MGRTLARPTISASTTEPLRPRRSWPLYHEGGYALSSGAMFFADRRVRFVVLGTLSKGKIPSGVGVGVSSCTVNGYKVVMYSGSTSPGPRGP